MQVSTCYLQVMSRTLPRNANVPILTLVMRSTAEQVARYSLVSATEHLYWRLLMESARNLPTLLPFAASVAFGLLAWGAVCLNYVWPRIRDLPVHAAARPILHLHLFRYIGLAFIVPGVVGPSLQTAFAAPAAYGDLVALALAAVALLMGSRRYSRIAIWTFSLWGFADLLFAFYQGTIGVGIDPASLGAAWFIPTVTVPLLLWTHVLVFASLLRTSPSGSYLGYAAH